MIIQGHISEFQLQTRPSLPHPSKEWARCGRRAESRPPRSSHRSLPGAARRPPPTPRQPFGYQRFDVLAPKFEGLSNFLRIAMALINPGYTGKCSGAVVQRQLNNMRSNTEPLQPTGEAPAQIVKRPRPDRWRDLFLCAAMIAKWTIRTVQHKPAGGGQGVEYAAHHRRDRDCVRQSVFGAVGRQLDRVRCDFIAGKFGHLVAARARQDQEFDQRTGCTASGIGGFPCELEFGIVKHAFAGLLFCRFANGSGWTCEVILSGLAPREECLCNLPSCDAGGWPALQGLVDERDDVLLGNGSQRASGPCVLLRSLMLALCRAVPCKHAFHDRGRCRRPRFRLQAFPPALRRPGLCRRQRFPGPPPQRQLPRARPMR